MQPAGNRRNGEGWEWEQERVERAEASQVVEYRDREGNSATWLGGPGEQPPAHLRKLFPLNYSPSGQNISANPYSTAQLPLEEVNGMMRKRLGARYI